MSKLQTYYHYTSMVHIKEIREYGIIKTTESNVSMEEEHAGPDVVWLFKEPLSVVPRMMYAPLLMGADKMNQQGLGIRQTDNEELERRFMGVWVPKTAVEITVSLPRDEVIRADKFLKKHKADPVWIEVLENGNPKFSKQFVITREITEEEITGTQFREDLMAQRKHSYRDWMGRDAPNAKKVKF